MGRPSDQIFDREHELATLRDALTRASAGAGEIILIEGAAGTGKSALMASGRAMATQAGYQLLSSRGGELERDYPFGIVRQLFEPVVGTADAATRSRLLSGAAAPAEWVLGLNASGSAIHAAGFTAIRAIFSMTAQLAAQAPLMIAIDDAHWADASSLRALDYLARRASKLRLVVAVAFRAEEPGAPDELLDELRSGPDVRRCALRALSPAAAARVVRARIPSAVDDVCAACYGATAGNPLYLTELLRSMNGADEIGVHELRYATIPSLGQRVLRRATAVSDDAAELARSMSVLGDGGRLSTAAALASIPETDAGQIAHRLRLIEILASEDPFSFVHPLIRRSVYDLIPESERQSAHRAAARLLADQGAPPETVAAHLSLLPPAGASDVAKALVAAADRALDQAAPDEAAEWLERAVAEGAPEPPRAELLASLGLAKTLLRDPAALVLLRDAHALAEQPELRTRLAATLAETLTHVGRWEDAIAVIDSAEAELSDAEPVLRTEVAALRAAITLFDPSLIDDFDARRERYLDLARGDSWAAHAIAALLAIESTNRGRPAEGVAHAERALAGGRLFGERAAGAWAAPHPLGAFVEAEELERAHVAIDQLAAAASASGSALGQFTMIGFRGWAHARAGDLAAAEAELTSVFDFIQDSGMLMGMTTAAFLLLDVLFEREHLEAVVELVDQTRLPPDFARTASGSMLLEARGSLALLRGDRDAAIGLLRSAGRINTRLRFGPAYSSWRSSLALALPISEREEARSLADEELVLARSSGLPRPQGIAVRTLGMLAPDSGAAIELLRTSVELLETSSARLERARSLVELGAALGRSNQRAAARGPLIDGLALAQTCGATRLARRAEQDLRAAGGRAPRALVHGVRSLTASEVRIVRLAADGASNAEIAQRLFISLKTVETHLYRAYGKLGLSGAGSRARLGHLLADSAESVS